MTHSEKTPRVYNLDAIRGVAVLGILFINIYFFGNPVYGYIELAVPSSSDIWLDHFSDLFLQGRFISLFSILFGAGLLIQQQNFNHQKLDGLAQSKRRLKWLMLFGALHGIFIWNGDILFVYAISGILSLNYYRLEPHALIKKACLFIIIGTVLTCVILMMVETEPAMRDSQLFVEELSIWTSSYSDQLFMQMYYFSFTAIVTPFSVMFYISGMMMLGMALYKFEVFSRGFSRRWAIKLLAASLLCFTLTFFLEGFNPNFDEALSSSLTLLGGLFMGLILRSQ